jgi:hypothetical protein
MLFIVSEGSDRVPPENFPSSPTTIAILSPVALVLIHVIPVISEILDIVHVMVWLCPGGSMS